MKKLLPILLLIAVIISMMLLSSCDDLFGGENEHEHEFSEWETVDAPTCTEGGLEARTCDCGEEETRSVPATGHSFGKWTTEKEATCAEDGAKTRSCKVCGEEKTEYIPMTDHAFGEWVTVKEATCNESGIKIRTCEACDKEETNSIIQLNHTYVSEIKEPTYTEYGYSQNKCNACGHKTEFQYIPATGTATGLDYSYVYSIRNEVSIKITGIGSFEGTDLIIPAYIEGLPVTHIEWEAFKGITNISSVYIPDTVTEIYGYAFSYCTNLSLVLFQGSICIIRESVFVGCDSLVFNESNNGLYLGTNNNPYFALICIKDREAKSITVHNDCKILAGESLSHLNELREAILPEGLIIISNYTFVNSTKLARVNIPDSVTHLGERVFSGCSSLESIEIGKGIDTLRSGAFNCCSSLVSVTIPNTIKEIGVNVFGNCKKLKTVTYLGTLQQWNKINRYKNNTEEGFYTVVCLDGEVIPNHPGEHEHAYSSNWFSNDNATMYKFCDLCGYKATAEIYDCEHNIDPNNAAWSEDGRYYTCSLCEISFYLKDVFTIDITDYEDDKLCLTLKSMLPGMHIDDLMLDLSNATVNIFTDKITRDLYDYEILELIYKVVLGENISYVDYIPYHQAEILVIGTDVIEIKDHSINAAFALREIYIEGDLPIIGNDTFYARNVADVDYDIMPTVYYYEGAKGFEGYKYKIQGCTLRMIGEEFDPIPDVTLKEYSVSAAEKSIEMAYEIFVRGAETRPYLQFIPYCSLYKYKSIKDFTLSLTAGLTTDREKAEAIFNWIVENIEYDDAAEWYTSDQVFETKKAVCAGYVALMHDMLAAVEIPSLYTNGINYFGTYLTIEELATMANDVRYIYEGNSHAWNICYLDGEVVICDPTWGIFDYSPEDMANNCIATITIQGIAVTPDGFDPRHQTSEMYFYYDQGELFWMYNGNVYKHDGSLVTYNNGKGFNYTFRIANDGQAYTGSFIDNKNAYHDTFMIYDIFDLQAASFAGSDFQIYTYRDVLNYAIFQNTYYGKNIVIDRMEDFIIDSEGNIYIIMENGELSVYGTASMLDVITIPEYVEGRRVTRINNNAFEGSIMKEINLPDSIELIGGGAFNDCRYLESITLPSGLKTIEPGAFARCYSLKSVYIPLSLELIGVPPENHTYFIPELVFYDIDVEQLTVYYEGTEEDFNNIHFHKSGKNEGDCFDYEQYDHVKSYVVFLGEIEE